MRLVLGSWSTFDQTFVGAAFVGLQVTKGNKWSTGTIGQYKSPINRAKTNAGSKRVRASGSPWLESCHPPWAR
jgi:hypothetical protein